MNRIFILCLISAIGGGIVATWLADPHTAWSPNQSANAQVTLPRIAPPSAREESPVIAAADTGGMTSFTPEELTNIRVYETANRGVVNISTRFESQDRFFPMLSVPGQGTGSGSILDKQGHILTNYHVVEDAREIEVTFPGGRSTEATLVGHDRQNDIAILKIDAPASELHPIALGSSDNLRVGQRVYALGNPFGLEGTITTGIISNLNRTLPSRVRDREMKSIIQTDAALNPGNSGGPLLDTTGRMIGMNVAIATRSGQNAGLGFAIPINRIARYIPELIATGKITRPDIGIVAVKETSQGLQIIDVNKGGPAERAGLRGWQIVRRQVRQGPFVRTVERRDTSQADYILEIDSQPVDTGSALIEKIEEKRPGENVMLTILRDGQRTQVSVTLGAT